MILEDNNGDRRADVLLREIWSLKSPKDEYDDYPQNFCS